MLDLIKVILSSLILPDMGRLPLPAPFFFTHYPAFRRAQSHPDDNENNQSPLKNRIKKAGVHAPAQ